MNALNGGEVDWIGRADLKTLNLLKKNPNIEITEVTGYGHYVFPMQVTLPPFDNLDVRTRSNGQSTEKISPRRSFWVTPLGNDNPIAPSIKFAINPEPIFEYDPEKAKFHLEKSRSETLKVNLSVAGAAFSGAVDAATLYKDHARVPALTSIL